LFSDSTVAVAFTADDGAGDDDWVLVFLIAALDRPYQGAVSVDAAAYQLVLDGVMTSKEK